MEQATRAQNSQRVAAHWSPRCRRSRTRGTSPRPTFRSIWRPGRAPARTSNRRAIFGQPSLAVGCSSLRLRPVLRAQCTRGQGGRTVQVHPQEVLLQQARELQASPAFDEARQRRQVVEHRIARLVQLGIRQARYVGRTKTLFQVCLAAAVANLTLLAATSGALSVSDSDGFSWSLVILAPLVGLSSLLLGSGLAALFIRHCATSTSSSI